MFMVYKRVREYEKAAWGESRFPMEYEFQRILC
jgi:hypothetical protein